MATSVPWVRLMFRDWLSDRRYVDLGSTAQAVFANLVMESLCRGGYIPDDREVLLRSSLAKSEDFDDAWRKITDGPDPLFRQTDDGTWINKRAAEEYERAVRYFEAQRERGKKGGRPPSKTRDKTREKPGGYPGDKPGAKPGDKPGGNPTQNSDLRSQILELRPQGESKHHAPSADAEEAPRRQDSVPECFETAWAAWLRVRRSSDQKATSKRAWLRAVSRLKDWRRFDTQPEAAAWVRDRILAGVEVVEGLDAKGEVPSLSTWLNDNRFDYEGDGFSEKILAGRRVRAQERRSGSIPARTTRTMESARLWLERGTNGEVAK